MKILIALVALLLGFFAWILCRAAALADREMYGEWPDEERR